MRKFFALFLCLLMVCASAAMAEDYWVEENWQKINREIDCDGLQLVIDARVMQVPEGTMVQEYHTKILNNEFMKETMNEVDWSKFGVDTSSGKWRQPTKDWPEYTYTSGENIYPTFSLFSINKFIFRKCSPEYANDLSGSGTYLQGKYPETVDLSPIGTLTETQVREAAEKVAEICGVQLGQPMNALRVEQVEVVRAAMERVINLYGNIEGISLNPADAEEYLFMDVLFPVYFHGLRLYSGAYESTTSGIEIPDLYMRIIVTKDHGLISARCPVFDPDDFVATTEPQRALNAEEMIDSISEQFANLYLPGVKQVTLNRLALEYAAVAGDVSASTGYTVYPVWVASYTYIMEREDRAPVMVYYGYDAITGQRMF